VLLVLDFIDDVTFDILYVVIFLHFSAPIRNLLEYFLNVCFPVSTILKLQRLFVCKV
jgi:hypothetical protein